MVSAHRTLSPAAYRQEWGTLTHLPRNDIPSGTLVPTYPFYVQHTLFPPFATIERISFSRNRAFVRCDLKTLVIRLPAGLASPGLGYTGSCRYRAGLENHRSLKSL